MPNRQELWRRYRELGRLLWWGIIRGKPKHRVGWDAQGHEIWRCTNCGTDYVGKFCPQGWSHYGQ